MEYQNITNNIIPEKVYNIYFANETIKKNYICSECYFNFPIETKKIFIIGNNKKSILNLISEICFAFKVELLKGLWINKH